MELFIAGQGKVSLGQADFVARGGEASIYARGGMAFKLYTDPQKMLPPAKIRELAVLDRPAFVRPEALLLDARNRPVGYTMRRVPDAHVLCQLFNRAFRERLRLTPEAMARLVRKLQEGVRYVHQKGMLIVDLNEMNFLLDRSLREIWFIDIELPAAIRAALQPVGNAMPHATWLFDGVAMQSLSGACYASLFPRPGACRVVRLSELDAHRIVDARFDNRVLMIAGIREGRYDRFIFRFDEMYRSYDLRIIEDISYSGLNFDVLESGICLCLNESEDLELFSNKPGSPEVKVITDPAVRGMRLFKNGTQALFARGSRLYSAAMQN